MHELQQFVDQLNWSIRAKSAAERRWDDERNVGLHVLGRRVSIDAACLHNAAKYLRGWRGSWRDDVQHSDPDAAVASKLILLCDLCDYQCPLVFILHRGH